jgi:hypothetical protein
MWYALDSSFLGLGTSSMDQTPDGETQPDDPATNGEAVIARQLTGELYCIGCGYNLRGLSIRSNCSECGIPVRATILGIVDPHADELSPLIAPRMTAIGLNAWSYGAMIAVAMIWVLRISDLIENVTGSGWSMALIPWIGIGGLAVSMLGGLTMIRPHRMVGRLEAVRSAMSVSLYGPLIFVYLTLYHQEQSANPSQFFQLSLNGAALRVVMFLLIAGIIWGLRPQAVGLAIRSVVVRTGRVDRQSLVAVLTALGIAAVGDVIMIASLFFGPGIGDVLTITSFVVIVLGSVLFSVGLINICIDTARLYPILVRPGVGLGDIFETNQQKSRRIEKQ